MENLNYWHLGEILENILKKFWVNYEWNLGELFANFVKILSKPHRDFKISIEEISEKLCQENLKITCRISEKYEKILFLILKKISQKILKTFGKVFRIFWINLWGKHGRKSEVKLVCKFYVELTIIFEKKKLEKF